MRGTMRTKCAANAWAVEQTLCGHPRRSRTTDKSGPGGLPCCLISRAGERTFPPACGLVQPCPPIWGADSTEVEDDVVSSYGIAEDTFWGTYGSAGVHSYSVTSVVKPTQMIVLGDSRWSGPGISSGFVARDPAWMGFWHTRRCNYAFWDGHLQALRAIATIRQNEGDCMWEHTFLPHSVHLQALDSARPEYK